MSYYFFKKINFFHWHDTIAEHQKNEIIPKLMLHPSNYIVCKASKKTESTRFDVLNMYHSLQKHQRI
jgi:hypothetical protein